MTNNKTTDSKLTTDSKPTTDPMDLTFGDARVSTSERSPDGFGDARDVVKKK